MEDVAQGRFHCEGCGKSYVTLPKKKEDRKKIFDWHKQNAAKYAWKPNEVDVGQKYLVLDFFE